jgi:hypothetical protein
MSGQTRRRYNGGSGGLAAGAADEFVELDARALDPVDPPAPWTCRNRRKERCVGRSSHAANLCVMYIARVMRSAAHEIHDVARAGTPTHGRLRHRLVGLAVATLAVDLACAALALLLEHDARQTQITSFGSALFWTSTQLLTVSSSIQNPRFSGRPHP